MIHEWPVGLSTGCFAEIRLVDCLEPIRDAGFGMIEVCSLPSHLDYHDHAATKRAADRIRELNLEAFSFHAPFAQHLDITALEARERRDVTNEILKAAEAAALLGARYFVIHPGPENAGLPRHERLDRMENAAEVLDRVARRCHELEVALVLENMLPHLFSGHVRELLWLLGALQTTEVGVCLDTGHAYLSGDLETICHKLSGHLWMIHANDNKGEYDDHLPPGKGDIRWDLFVEQLDRIRFSGSLILEIAGSGDIEETLQRAAQARAFLRGLTPVPH